ncbi:MAG: histidinol-phosphatase [Nitrospirota bacterium]|nr:histidinol-phosphatase [Nitrospirota bacterium]
MTCPGASAPPLAEQVARSLERVADLLEGFGENPHRVRAYRNGAGSFRSHAGQIARRLAAGTLERLPGIGRELAAKAAEVADSGTLAAIAELESRIPAAAARLAALPGVDTKLAIYLSTRLHVETPSHLRQLVATHMLRTIPWVGPEGELAVRRGLTELAEG